MSKINYFPLGIAKGIAFCNRVTERKQLICNLNKGQHTIVISPRRYGKSSLVLYSLEETKFLYERVDLFVAVSAKTIEEQILKGVKNMLNKVSSMPEQVVGHIKNYIKTLKSKWVVGTDGVSIELIPGKENDTVGVITEALQMLENVLRKKEINAVFFIDEFQEIGVLANSKGIEGAIRHVAQESERLRFIFSGSNRHILANMFDDRSRPLYSLCDRITIDRIHEEDYITYLNMVAKKSWKKHLDASILDEIFTLTEHHPYYMNVLCDKLWGYCDEKLPTNNLVTKLWKEYILQEESKIAKELGSLNTSQKKLLIAVAQGATKDLSSKATLHEFDLSSGAVIKALKFLEEQDYLGRNKNGEYFVVDPLIKASLILFYPPK
ncbi:MAG: AAA family ATPase [Gammaproteobacteria bacterium]